MGSFTTVSRRPFASVMFCKRSKFSASGRWFSSPGLGSSAMTTVAGATKRARSSTCPCVSSPAMPRPSQSTFSTPRYSAKMASSAARSSPGFRCWTSLSRHSSVVSIVPSPSQSMLPPSSTTVVGAGLPPRPGASGHEAPHLAVAGDARGDAVVASEVGIFCPTVESPIHHGHTARRFRRSSARCRASRCDRSRSARTRCARDVRRPCRARPSHSPRRAGSGRRSRPARAGRASSRSRCTPTRSPAACPANPRLDEASRATCRGAVPTPPAAEIRRPSASRVATRATVASALRRHRYGDRGKTASCGAPTRTRPRRSRRSSISSRSCDPFASSTPDGLATKSRPKNRDRPPRHLRGRRD